MESRIFTTHELRAFLDWFMFSDPWEPSVQREPIHRVLEAESRRHGYENWIEAYHRVPRLD